MDRTEDTIWDLGQRTFFPKKIKKTGITSSLTVCPPDAGDWRQVVEVVGAAL